MTIEAIFFVNWIFWAAISAGTLLVVGLTELGGGTTRGYRLFMAALLVLFAAVLVASDLALPPDVTASATQGLRRPLTLAFAAGAGLYLVASIGRGPGSPSVRASFASGRSSRLPRPAGRSVSRSSPRSSCWPHWPSAR
jgi:hypothetical protein